MPHIELENNIKNTSLKNPEYAEMRYGVVILYFNDVTDRLAAVRFFIFPTGW